MKLSTPYIQQTVITSKKPMMIRGQVAMKCSNKTIQYIPAFKNKMNKIYFNLNIYGSGKRQSKDEKCQNGECHHVAIASPQPFRELVTN
jgi:hypothetical protein